MAPLPFPTVTIDLARIRRNVIDIVKSTGTDVIAVVKADAYGLGAHRVAVAVADLVSGFYTLTAREAIEADLPRLGGRATISALAGELSPAELVANRIRPGVWSRDMARHFARCDPVLVVDTGQQRFACPARDVEAILDGTSIGEAYTHASNVEQARQFGELTVGRRLRRHAAGSALLNEPVALFDAVRPGLAMYRGAVRVTTTLMEARESVGPVGYTGFSSRRHGVVMGGYYHGISRGVCTINGRRTRIPEVGMQTAFVELTGEDKVGDEVVFLGDDVSEQVLAESWGCSAQEVLVRLCRAGRRMWVGA